MGDLRGTDSYGQRPTNPTSGPTGTMQWNYNAVQYFMFSTGDFSEWMIMKRQEIDGKFGSYKQQEIVCSSEYNTAKYYAQYFRPGCCNEDPWLSYRHHGTSSMMYGEAGFHGHSENVLKGGMNVWIYPPQKPAADLTPKSVGDICNMYGGKKLPSNAYQSGNMWGVFGLARRVAQGTRWHPATDDLRGTDSYGQPPTDPTSGPTGTMRWN